MTGDNRRRAGRAWLVQAALLAVLALALWALFARAFAALRARGVHVGFDFLSQPAGFELGESWLATDAGQPFWRALGAGLANTVRVAVPAIVLTTLLGGLIGIGRRAPHILVRGLCFAYVELIRNIPLLVQLLMWYFALTTLLPDPAQPLHLPGGLWLSKNGLAFPWLTSTTTSAAGHGWPIRLDWPAPGPLSVSGGAAVTPEFLAVLLALTIYTAAFVAEVVRAGIESVPVGLIQAAQAQGLRPRQVLRWVVVPQALRVIVPSLTNQYLNLIKNSTLAVAVGYPDLVSVGNTAINQTGRAFECIAVIMAVYLALSLLTSAAMNRGNARLAVQDGGA